MSTLVTPALLRTLQSAVGQGTTLVTVYTPAGSRADAVGRALRSELASAENIKRKDTKQRVQWALQAISSALVNEPEVFEHGAAMFAGSTEDGDLVHIVHGPEPLKSRSYACGRLFDTKHLEATMNAGVRHALVILDGAEATIAAIQGSAAAVIWTAESHIPRKHGQGGQSQQRFQRLHEEWRHNWFKRVAGHIEDAFLRDMPEIVFIAGPGHTKNDFLASEVMHYELRKRVHAGLIDTGYTDDSQGVREAMRIVAPLVEDAASIKARTEFQDFVRLLQKGDPRTVLGVENVQRAVAEGRVAKLFAVQADLGQDAIVLPETSSEAVMLRSLGGCAGVLHYA